MVRLSTNRPDFANDISEEIRAFLGIEEIALCEDAPSSFDQGALSLRVTLADGTATAQALLDGRESRYAYPMTNIADTPLTRKRYEKRAVKIAAYRALRELFPETPLPWGSLTGIRPTKLLRELIETLGEAEALRMMTKEFDVSVEKLKLAREIVGVQAPIIGSMGEKDADVYIGIPFCKTRCLYCSFASETLGRGSEKLPPYLIALKEDIAMSAAILKDAGYRVRSMYMGGGTPTVLSADQLRDLIEHALACYGGYGQEFTVEAGRPDTIDRAKLNALKGLGVGRISINPQTMNDETLSRVGRSHTANDIVSAYEMARSIGFESINMDLIAGLPGENFPAFEHSLKAVAALMPDNLTIHTLAVKRSSRLKRELDEYPLSDADAVAKMVDLGMACAKEIGLRPYYTYRQKYMRGNLENVGYAAPGKECVYNVDMMEEIASIMANGAGAMTKRVFPGRELRVERIPNPKDVSTYQEKLAILEGQKRGLFVRE